MKKIQSLLLCLLLMSMCVFTNCKDEDKDKIKDVLDDTKAKVKTSDPSDISFISATVGGVISNSTGDKVLAKGVCWSNNNEDPTVPDVSSFKIETLIDGLKDQNLLALSTDSIAADGSFTCSFRGLPNKTYKVRAFVISTQSFGSNDRVTYGEVVALSTTTIVDNASKPIVQTDTVQNVTKNSAVGYGKVTTANSTILKKGVCWGPEGSIIDAVTDANLFSFADKNASDEMFSSNIKGLEQGKKYKFKAFAVNKDGIGYGEEVEFSTPPVNK